MLKQYYLRFLPTANIDYLFLLNLYDLADYNTDTKTYNLITYKSLAGLAECLGVSDRTVRRHLENAEYEPFLQWDKKNKRILLYNDFSKTGYRVPFITVSPVEVRLLKD
jgi:transcriptional antiterminator